MTNNELTRRWKELHINPDFRAELRPEIRASWERSIQCRVDPGMRENPYIYEAGQLKQAQEKSRYFIETALPVMKSLYEFVAGTGFVVALFDADVCVLKVIGDEESLSWAKQARFIEGSLWEEKLVGTNGGCLAIDLAEPISVFGYEHFCLFSHVSASSCAPVIDQGRIIGGLGMVAPVKRVSNHTLGMVVASVKHIESKMILERTTRYNQVLMESMSEGVLAVDPNGIITYLNEVGAKILNCSRTKSIGSSIYEVLGHHAENHRFLNTITHGRQVSAQTFVLKLGQSKVKCNITCNPINDPDLGGQQGTVVILRESHRMNRLVRNWIGMGANMTFDGIIGVNQGFQKTIKTAQSAASSCSNVLLLGESGTGKDIIAQAMHNASPRRNNPFIAINCAALPRELIASELFGYEEGAFTGAKKGGNTGKFELADQGTIFLDEIGDMPLDLQASLLRVIEEKSVIRLGGNKLIPVNVRIIAATNRDLENEINRGRFRRDLYFRLGVIRINIPPLRERPEDIILLAHHLCAQTGERFGKPNVTLSAEVIEAFRNYDWPGNVREMQNVLESAVQLAADQEITLDLVEDCFLPNTGSLELPQDHLTDISQVEKQMIKQYLIKFRQNKTKTAEALGISRQTLYRRLKEYGLD
jgi:transcriptional regulator with PAS, ATPase and Fis domain